MPNNSLNDRVADLEKRVSRFELREEGMTLTSKLIIGAIGLVVTILAGIGTVVGLYFTFTK